MLCWKPSRKFFPNSRKRMFYSRKSRKSWILRIILIVYITACSGLPPPATRGPGVRQENGTAHLPFPSQLAAKLPKVWVRHSQIPWSWSTSSHLLLVLPSVSEVSRNKLQIQQPSFQKWGFARAKRQGHLVFAVPLMRPLLMAPWGLRIRVYFRESSSKDWAKVKEHFEGSGPVSLAKKNPPNQEQPVLRRGFRDASRTFTRLWRSYPW